VGLVSGKGFSTSQPADQVLGTGERLTIIAALPDLERLMRREPPPGDWSVEVTAFPPPARSMLIQLMWERQSATAQMADGALDHLPLCLGRDLTRGQAEDLLVRLRRENVKARAEKTEKISHG
jgi:hypothetical protein